jgi:hypothetical protein
MYDNKGKRKSVQTYTYREVVLRIARCGHLSAEGLLKRGHFSSTLMKEKYIINV